MFKAAVLSDRLDLVEYIGASYVEVDYEFMAVIG
jgi:hypothetical protein